MMMEEFVSQKLYAVLPDGRQVTQYTLSNGNGMSADILDFGGIVTGLFVPGRDGNAADIALCHGTPEMVLQNPGYLGAVVGRNSNRIKDARFMLGGTCVVLDQNDHGNNLHGGPNGLSSRLFSGCAEVCDGGARLTLTHRVKDGSDGFPGNLNVRVVYTLTENALVIDYDAVSDSDTVINLTNHTYFNLAGHDSGNIYGQILEIDADFYTPLMPDGMPTGEILSVKGTPLDFTGGKAIGTDIGSDYAQVSQFGGYDHNFVLNGIGFRRVVTVCDPVSGREMSVLTDRPGIQLYTSNMLDISGTFKNGAVYGRHQGYCLETQAFPDAVNTPWFGAPFFRAGEHFLSRTEYRFDIAD